MKYACSRSLIFSVLQLSNFFDHFADQAITYFKTKYTRDKKQDKTVNAILMQIRQGSELPNNRTPTGNEEWAVLCKTSNGTKEGTWAQTS